MNDHEQCSEYHKPDDLCLLFFQLTDKAFDVSTKTEVCLKHELYGDDS